MNTPLITIAVVLATQAGDTSPTDLSCVASDDAPHVVVADDMQHKHHADHDHHPEAGKAVKLTGQSMTAEAGGLGTGISVPL